MKPPVVLLATRNAAKLRELAPLFAAAGLKTVDLAGLEVEEEADAEAENPVDVTPKPFSFNPSAKFVSVTTAFLHMRHRLRAACRAR